MQNCPTPRVNEPTNPSTIDGPPRLDRGSSDEHRVHAAQLAVERDGSRSRVGQVEQRTAPCGRAGEGRGGDALVDECGSADLDPGDRGQGPLGRACGSEGISDDLGDPEGQGGMAGAGLHHDRAAGGERGRRVASGHREGEREVAGCEHEHGPDWLSGTADVGTGSERPVGVGVVDDRLHVFAVEGDLGEEPQLVAGAGELGTQPGFRQVALGSGDGDELVCGAFERVRSREQEASPLRRRHPAQDRCGVDRSREDGVELRQGRVLGGHGHAPNGVTGRPRTPG